MGGTDVKEKGLMPDMFVHHSFPGPLCGGDDQVAVGAGGGLAVAPDVQLPLFAAGKGGVGLGADDAEELVLLRLGGRVPQDVLLVVVLVVVAHHAEVALNRVVFCAPIRLGAVQK